MTYEYNYNEIRIKINQTNSLVEVKTPYERELFSFWEKIKDVQVADRETEEEPIRIDVHVINGNIYAMSVHDKILVVDKLDKERKPIMNYTYRVLR